MYNGETLGEVLVQIRDLLYDIKVALTLGAAPINPSDFIEAVTPKDVTINPGETKEVLKVKGSGYLWEVGANDETYSTYMLEIDGNPVGKSLPQPWGLYNDPYRFPQPIRFSSYVLIAVKRHEDAPSAADYYAKVRYVRG